MITTYAGLARWDHPTSSTPVPSMKVRKMNLLLWCFGAAARIATASEVVPSTCHQTDDIQILEDARVKGVNRACIGFALRLEGLNKDDCVAGWAIRTAA